MPLKVLTVDDSKTIRMIVKKAFRPYDCKIFEAENGVDGLSVAGREKPNLIILDITMPVMNGIEMLEKLKAVPDLRDIPVIMLTAESGKDNVMHIVKMGVKDYIVKPFKDVQLIEKVKNVVSLQEKNPEEADSVSAEKFFAKDGEFQFLRLPVKVNRPTVIEIENSLLPTLKAMQSEGRDKLIVDLSKVGEINVSLVKLLVAALQKCQEVGIKSQVVGSSALGGKLKGFQETSWVEVKSSVDEAKASFGE